MFLVEKISDCKKYFAEIISLSIPMIVGNLGQVLIGATDVFIAAKHSTNTLAAISIANSIIFCILVMGMGLMSAISIQLSNLRGNRKPTKKFLVTVLNYSMILALIFCVICLLMVPLIPYMGFESELVPMIKEYIFICSFSLFGMYLYQCLREFLMAYEIVTFPNIILIFAIIFNFILAYILVFGIGSIPALGVIGLALTALIVRMLMGLILFVYCLGLIRFKNPFDTSLIKQLLKIGYPIGIAMFLEFLGFNLITILVGRDAGILAATHNIGVTITSSAYVIPMSISAAIAIKVGYNNGAKNYTEILRYSVFGTLLSVVFMGCCSILLFTCPKQLFEIFTDNKEMLALGLPILHIAAFYLMFDGLQVSLSGVLKGLKMTKIASASLIAGYWLFGLPFGYFLAYHYNMSLRGFWIGLATSFLFMSIIFLSVIFKKFRQLKKLYL